MLHYWSVRHPVVLTALAIVIVFVATSGLAAMPWSSNSGCADSSGTRDADVSLQLVPFGLVCDYEADPTGPAERAVLAPGIPVFAAWLLFVGAAVAIGVRRRARPAARGLVSGLCLLGLFGLLSTFWEMTAAMLVIVLYGVVVAALVDLWLWPATGRWWALGSTALLLPFGMIAAWLAAAFGMGALAEWAEPFGDWGYAVADVGGLAAAAVIAAVFSRVRRFALPARMEPL